MIILLKMLKMLKRSTIWFSAIYFLSSGAASAIYVPTFAIPKPPQVSTHVLPFEETAYKCYTAMSCIYKNATHNKMAECAEPGSEKMIPPSVEVAKLFGLEPPQYDSIYKMQEDFYCSVDPEERVSRFEKMMKYLIDYNSGTCIRVADPQICAYWELLMECIVELFEKMELQGECDLGDFDSA